MRQAWATQALIRQGLNEARPGSYTWFLTVGEGADPREFADHSEAVGRFLEDLWVLFARVRKLKRKADKRPYIGVREVQMKRLRERGEVAWHTHLLVLDCPKVDFEQVRRLLVRHGLGARFNVKTFFVGGPTSASDSTGDLARYLSKSLGGYLTKSCGSEENWGDVIRLLPKGKRLVVSSRSWASGLTLTKMKEARIEELRRGAFFKLNGRYPEASDGVDLVAAVAVAMEACGLLLIVDDADDPPPAPPPTLF